MTVAWVVGANGLLGRSVRAAIASRPGWSAIAAPPLPWADPASIAAAATTAAKQLIAAARERESSWVIVWAAGAGVVGSAPGYLSSELEQLQTVLAATAKVARSSGLPGAVFYASSAGGVYGGSPHPPFSEESEPRPISPYGEFKLKAERAVEDFAVSIEASSLIGRIANLYGPGQKLEKMQGIISQVAKSQFSTAPAMIYVPLDTMRDYLFAPDCAELVLDSLERLETLAKASGRQQVVKILASGQPVTIGALLGCFRWIAKSAPNVMLGSSPSTALQPTDLRLRSQVWPDLDQRQLTSLPAGIRSTINDILSGMQAGPNRAAV